MQRAKDQVARTCHVKRGLHRFGVANLADQNNVRRRTHRALQRSPVGFCIEADLSLIDDRFLVRVQEFDRIFDCDDV